ncbi:MAG: Holliday junction branch migration protein RuvA [Treponema sp.]|nr:Holliday junction branch migration protein RuvA [Treponema sp.]
MFNSISGVITGKFDKSLHLLNSGIEWDILVPDSSLNMLGPVGSEAKVFTWLQHTEQLMNLYGFASKDERDLFFDLLKVDGVGPKGALKIMSNVSSSRLSEILERGDLEMLEKIPGVGKKTAGKLLLALKGKVRISEEKTIVRTESSEFQDVIISLSSMGFDKSLVQSKIAELSQRFEKEGAFAGKSKKEKEDLLFKKAIVELS